MPSLYRTVFAALLIALAINGCSGGVVSYGQHGYHYAGTYRHYRHYRHAGIAGLLIGASTEYAIHQGLHTAEQRDRSSSGEESDVNGPACGVERWAVKTLRDLEARAISMTPKDTTVEWLVAQHAPYDANRLHRRYGAVEKTLWRVRARLVGYALENDSDYHLVIAGESGTPMIAEIPSEQCVVGARGKQYMAERALIRQVGGFRPERRSAFHWLDGTAKPPMMIFTGVGFFDVPHGQNGLARNAVELHPLLSVQRG